MTRKAFVGPVFCLLLAAPLAAAPFALPLYPPTTGEITVPLVAERFASFERDLRTLSAAFRQSVSSNGTGQAQSVAGTFAFAKGDRMRIEHRTPDPQTLVCDGSRVWVWRPANAQVIRAQLKAWKKSQPLAQGLLDFGGYTALFKRYQVTIATVSAPGPDGQRSLALALKPRSEPGRPEGDSYTLTLRLSTRDFFPSESELRMGEMTARTVLSDVRFNPDLPETLFQFQPPAGADVLDYPAAPN